MLPGLSTRIPHEGEILIDTKYLSSAIAVKNLKNYSNLCVHTVPSHWRDWQKHMETEEMAEK
jgi:hypothetical protein